MHELGVVFQIIDQVESVAKENDVQKIHSVTLRLGEVSTVIPDYLTSCWNWARKKHDLLLDAELLIERIPAVTFCENCRKTYDTMSHGKTCPHCGSSDTYLVQGNEFLIKEIEAE